MQIFYHQPTTDAWLMILDIYGWSPWNSMDSPDKCQIMYGNVRFLSISSADQKSLIPNDYEISFHDLISHYLEDRYAVTHSC